jgi:hypothetical protein
VKLPKGLSARAALAVVGVSEPLSAAHARDRASARAGVGLAAWHRRGARTPHVFVTLNGECRAQRPNPFAHHGDLIRAEHSGNEALAGGVLHSCCIADLATLPLDAAVSATGRGKGDVLAAGGDDRNIVWRTPAGDDIVWGIRLAIGESF